MQYFPSIEFAKMWKQLIPNKEYHIVGGKEDDFDLSKDRYAFLAGFIGLDKSLNTWI